MDSLITGKTLLVGEGDFSFTVALVTKLPSELWPCITATSLETEDTIKKHVQADSHIEGLREKGVTVLLQTDATVLHENPAFRHQSFSQIVFNFPHAGGKSNHKKNRKLLNDFFSSAVQVLSKAGQVIVTLCKGQGGTPADQPMRAWHDSWQVVSMAANSGLILVKTQPFVVEENSIYSSTGFRSQDKGFNTENAVTHVFESADQVNVPAEVEDGAVVLSGEIYSCPRYFHQKLQHLRFLENCPPHPFNQLSSLLCSEFKHQGNVDLKQSDWPENPVRKETKVDCGQSENSCTEFSAPVDRGQTPREVTPSELLPGQLGQGAFDGLSCEDLKETNLLKLPAAYCVAGKLDEKDGNCVVLDEPEIVNSCTKSCGPEEKPTNNNSQTKPHFRQSLLENVSKIFDLRQNGLQLYSGPVFKHCDINPMSFPVQYHMTGIWAGSHDHTGRFDWSETVSHDPDKPSDTGCQESKLHSDYIIQQNCSNLKTVLTNVVNSGAADNYHSEFLPSDSDASVSVSSGCQHFGSVVMQSTNKSFLAADVYTYQPASQEAGCRDYTVFLVYLDTLATICYNIEDPRYLLSTNAKVISQFQDLADKKSTFKPTSLYPMTFTHDMSFWENPEVQFDEGRFMQVIRDVAVDSVASVALIDTYRDVSSCRVSRCYRLVFQSCDQALSYDCSWRLQSLIRLEVAKHMAIELR